MLVGPLTLPPVDPKLVFPEGPAAPIRVAVIFMQPTHLDVKPASIRNGRCCYRNPIRQRCHSSRSLPHSERPLARHCFWVAKVYFVTNSPGSLSMEQRLRVMQFRLCMSKLRNHSA
jgi:hypothetical protein